MMRFFCVFTFILFSFNVYADDIVRIKKSIEIKTDISSVFYYVCDYFNDIEWREEVNNIKANGEIGVGTIFIEDAKLGRAKNFITETEMLTLIEDKECVAETTANNPYFLRSSRLFAINKNGNPELTYFVEFDKNMSKEMFGFVPPASTLKFFYGKRMKKYLKVLKTLLENK